MSNFNDAEITSLYVSATNATGIQDDAPNAPAAGPPLATTFDVTMEMVAGGAVGGPYTLVTTCSNVSDTAPEPGLNPPPGPLNGPGNFQANPPWKNPAPGIWTFDNSVTINIPAGVGGGKVYRYTAALFNPSGQVVSTKQSDLFILL